MVFFKNKEILSREESEGFSLFNPENGELHKLNKHAFFLFNILEQELTIDEIKMMIKSEFLIRDDAELTDSVLKILDDFKSKNIVYEK